MMLRPTTAMSLPSSSQPLYHAIPQTSVDASHGVVPLDGNEETESTELGFETSHPALVDTRTEWIYFMLGCSVLLPWNGMSLFWLEAFHLRWTKRPL